MNFKPGDRVRLVRTSDEEWHGAFAGTPGIVAYVLPGRVRVHFAGGARLTLEQGTDVLEPLPAAASLWWLQDSYGDVLAAGTEAEVRAEAQARISGTPDSTVEARLRKSMYLLRPDGGRQDLWD